MRTIDLTHIKSSAAAVAGNGSSANTTRVAFWGAVKSNKDDATVRFLLRKASSEGGLTPQQEGLLLAAQQRLALQGRPPVPTTPSNAGDIAAENTLQWGRIVSMPRKSKKGQDKGVKGGSKRPRSAGRTGGTEGGRSVNVQRGTGGIYVSITPAGRSVSSLLPGGVTTPVRKFAQGRARRKGGKGDQGGSHHSTAAGNAAAAGRGKAQGGKRKKQRSGSTPPSAGAAPPLPVQARLAMSLDTLLRR